MRGIVSGRPVWVGSALALALLASACATLRPAGSPPPTIAAEPAVETAAPTFPAASPAPASPEPPVHLVLRGESLSGIARRYGTTVQALVERNGLPDPDRIEVGQRLLLPGRPEAPLVDSAPTEPTLVDGLAWPVAGGHVLSPFGAPRGGRAHTGVDIGGRSGQPILAAEGGQVVFAGTLRGYGSTVVLEHRDGLRSLYAHNRELLVALGDSVQRGDTIALLGRSGNATTDHCHFEVRRGEVPLDPLALLTRAQAVSAAEARP